MSAQKTEVVGTWIMEWAVNQAEAQGHFNQELQRLKRFQNIAEQRVYAIVQRLDQGLPVPPGQLEVWEKATKHFVDKIDKIKHQKNGAIDRNLGVGMALYCQKHGLAQARKVADALFWRMVYLQGAEAAGRILDKLFNDILKAGVEGKLGMGSY